MLATTYAANALSVSVPLAGPELATAFTFRRFTRQSADAPLAGWSLLAGGVASSAAAAVIVIGGGLSSGSGLVTAAAVPAGLLAVAALVLLGAAAHRPGLRRGLERPGAWLLRHGSRLFRRPADDPRHTVRAWLERLTSLRLPASGWLTVTALALANWLADAAVLAVSIHTAGAAVPWHVLLLVYGFGVAAQSLNITPGGLGLAEGTLGLGLIAAGLHASQALAAVLLYRLASFWLVAITGWLVFLWLGRGRPSRRAAISTAVRSGDLASGLGPAAVPGNESGRRTADDQDSARSVPQRADGALRSHYLVLLHGQPGSAADWQPVSEQLPHRLRTLAAERPGYGASPLPPAGFAGGAHAVLAEMDARGIRRAVLVGHSYGGGVALSVASQAPHRVEAVILLASVGPGCLSIWDRLLAAPVTGPLCALVAWRLTPWIARARLARITRRSGRPPDPGEHVNWQIWAQAAGGRDRLWRTFLAEQRALLAELDGLVSALPSIRVPVLVMADPDDAVVPIATARSLTRAVPDARLQMVEGAGHHLPRRAAAVVSQAIEAFVTAVDAAE
jgi:pimeloyl-ACP methyl ester carboxylesterase